MLKSLTTILSLILWAFFYNYACFGQGLRQFLPNVDDHIHLWDHQPSLFYRLSQHPLSTSDSDSSIFSSQFAYWHVITSKNNKGFKLKGEAFNYELAFLAPVKHLGIISSLGTGHQNMSFNASAKIPKSEIRYSEFNREFKQNLFVATGTISSGVKTGLTLISHYTQNDNGLYYNLPLQLTLPFKTTVLFSQKLSGSHQNLLLQTNDDRVKLPLDFDLLSEYIRISTTINDLISAVYAYESSTFVESQLKSISSDYDMIPFGWQFTHYYGLNFKFNSTAIDVGLAKASLFSNADLFYQNTKFGKLIRLNIKSSAFKIGLHQTFHNHGFWLSYRYDHYDFEGKLRVETWPFSSSTVDLLGVRHFGESVSELEIQHVLFSYTYSKHVLIKPTIEYFDITPRVSAQTWRPLFLTFGITDLQNHALNYEKITAIQLSLKTTIPIFKRLDFSYQFTQFIPLDIEKTKQPQGTPPSGQTPKKTVETTTGGSFHWTALYFYFN